VRLEQLQHPLGQHRPPRSWSTATSRRSTIADACSDAVEIQTVIGRLIRRRRPVAEFHQVGP